MCTVNFSESGVQTVVKGKMWSLLYKKERKKKVTDGEEWDVCDGNDSMLLALKKERAFPLLFQSFLTERWRNNALSAFLKYSN